MSDPQSVPQKPPFEETEDYREHAQWLDESIAENRKQLQTDTHPALLGAKYYEDRLSFFDDLMRQMKEDSLNRLRKAYDRGEL